MMINIEDYGKLLEEYEYKLNKNEVEEINYTEYNPEDGTEKRNIQVKKEKRNSCKRMYLDKVNKIRRVDTLCEMGLCLNIVEPCNIYYDATLIYTYDNAKEEEKTTEGFNVKLPYEDNKDIIISLNKNQALFYDHANRRYTTTEQSSEGSTIYFSGTVYMRDFGFIKRDDNSTEIFDTLFNKTMGYVYFPEGNSPIDILRHRSASAVMTNGNKYKYYQYKNDMVYKVTELCNSGGKLDMFSRYEIEDRDSDIIPTTRYDSIYPTACRDNYDLYRYPYLHIWTHDKLIADETTDEPLYFERKNVLIDKFEEFNDLIKSNPDQLQIG